MCAVAVKAMDCGQSCPWALSRDCEESEVIHHMQTLVIAFFQAAAAPTALTAEVDHKRRFISGGSSAGGPVAPRASFTPRPWCFCRALYGRGPRRVASSSRRSSSLRELECNSTCPPPNMYGWMALQGFSVALVLGCLCLDWGQSLGAIRPNACPETVDLLAGHLALP